MSELKLYKRAKAEASVLSAFHKQDSIAQPGFGIQLAQKDLLEQLGCASPSSTELRGGGRRVGGGDSSQSQQPAMSFPSASDKNWPGLMRNDDLTDSVTGDWRQPGAP